MIRWGASKPIEPVLETTPTQDVDNLQPDESGFYTLSFTNDKHFSTFEVNYNSDFSAMLLPKLVIVRSSKDAVNTVLCEIRDRYDICMCIFY